MGSVSDDSSVSNQLHARHESVDNLRFFATVAVIMVHVSAFSRTPGFNIDLLYGSFSRFCVPIFVMLTGALLLPKSYDLNFYLKNKFIRILFPFLFWGGGYLAHEMHKYATKSIDNGINEFISHAFNIIKNQDTLAPHLWYVYMIIGIYLFIPLISKAAQYATDQEIRFYLIIWFLMLFFEFKGLYYFKMDIDLRYFTGYLGYLILGYYLYNRVSYTSLGISLSLAITGLLITIYGTYSMSQKEGRFNHDFYEYLTPNVTIYAMGIFLIIQKISVYQLPENIKKLREFVTSHSYGIYLVHWLVLLSFDKVFNLNSKAFMPIISIPLITLLFLSVSGCIIWLIRKLPFGKYISG